MRLFYITAAKDFCNVNERTNLVEYISKVLTYFFNVDIGQEVDNIQDYIFENKICVFNELFT